MKTKKRIVLILPMLSIALVMGVYYFLSLPSFRLTMDVNPSIEIVTNRLERVVEVKPLNEDAEKMLTGFTQSTRTLEATVNELVDLMILGGYIEGGHDNIVMISVKDLEADGDKVAKINEIIRAYLENKQIEATLVAGTLPDTIGSASLSGKEAAIGKLEDKGASLSREDLERMTLRELLEYTRAQNLNDDDIFRILSSLTYQQTTPKEGMISLEEAKEIALREVTGEVVKFELDDNEYEVKVLSSGRLYEFEIDAFTGRVREMEIDDFDDDRIPLDDQSRRVNMEEARNIALGRVNGEIMEADLEDDHYEFKIQSDGKVYEVEVHRSSGEIKKVELEDFDDDFSGAAGSGTKITLAEARRIALGRVQGTVMKEELDEDSYDFDIQLNGKKYEVEVHAYTGAIKEIEVDDFDDDDSSVLGTGTRLTMEAARKIALGRVNGSILEEKLDDDRYDFEIRLDGQKYEVEVHSYTGEIVKYELDRED